MSSVLALIPARSGSRGIPNKNFRELGGKPLWLHATECAIAANCQAIVSTDAPERCARSGGCFPDGRIESARLVRPATLAQDDTPMIDVVRHALREIPGPDEQIILLLQPTQPFRTPDHLREAIRRLETSGADSVVSVVELPLTHHPDFALRVTGGRLYPMERFDSLLALPTRRQAVAWRPAYIRDGTVYAFRRATVDRYGMIYGQHVVPLIIPPEQSCELDTLADWANVERRWREQHG